MRGRDTAESVDQPRTVLVLGMHRSGTSLLAQVLDRAGVAMGDNLMPPDEHNPDGYFEDLEIVAVHDRILTALDRAWGSMRSTLPLPEGWQQHPEVIAGRADLRAIVDRRLAARAEAAWGFKDPRTCRLLPLWLDLLDEAGSPPVLLLSNRAPAEVARSLEKRDGLPPRIGELLWLIHVLEVLETAADRIAAVVDWDRWFADPQAQVPALAAAVGLPAEALAAAVDATLKPDLRRQRAEAAPAAVPLAAEVHALLARWSREAGKPPSALADAIRRFYDAQATLAGWADVAQAQDWTAELHRRDVEISRLKGDRDAAQAGLAEYRAAYDRDMAAFSDAYNDAMAAYRQAEERLKAVHHLEYDLALARAQTQKDLEVMQAVLAEIVAVPGFGRIRVPPPQSAAEAAVHIRNLVFSARWAALWPLRRAKASQRKDTPSP